MHKDCSPEKIEEKLKVYKRDTMAATERVAAVLLPVARVNGECCVVFTKRPRDLNRHGGEVSFPGGIMENEDVDTAAAALRETHEEIGIRPDDVRILGTLSDELSRWGHRVTPYVGLLESTDFIPQASEVERLYEVPVSYLMKPEIYYSETWIRGKERRLVHFFRYGNDIIWGLTARILFRFLSHMSRKA